MNPITEIQVDHKVIPVLHSKGACRLHNITFVLYSKDRCRSEGYICVTLEIWM